MPLAVAIPAIASVAGTAVSALGSESPKAPANRSLESELSQILSQAEPLLASEQATSPQYTKLDLSNLGLALGGDATTPGLYDLLDTGTRRVGATQNAANTTARASTMADLVALDPELRQLVQTQMRKAQTGLEAGTRLTPDEIYSVTNPTRSNWASRGFGDSAPAQLDEALQLFAGGQKLYQTRLGNADNASKLDASLYTLPAMQYAPDTTATAAGLMGGASSVGDRESVFEQLGGYAEDLNNTNFNSAWLNATNKANLNNARWNAAGSMVSSLGGLFS